jgi:hypothetical protein
VIVVNIVGVGRAYALERAYYSGLVYSTQASCSESAHVLEQVDHQGYFCKQAEVSK